MIEVKLLGHDGKQELEFGSLQFDGTKITPVKGPDGNGRVIENVLRYPIILPDGTVISSESNPLEFMNNLFRQYRSHALRATKPL